MYISFKSFISPIDDIWKDTIFYFEFLIAMVTVLLKPFRRSRLIMSNFQVTKAIVERNELNPKLSHWLMLMCQAL